MSWRSPARNSILVEMGAVRVELNMLASLQVHIEIVIVTADDYIEFLIFNV